MNGENMASDSNNEILDSAEAALRERARELFKSGGMGLGLTATPKPPEVTMLESEGLLLIVARHGDPSALEAALRVVSKIGLAGDRLRESARVEFYREFAAAVFPDRQSVTFAYGNWIRHTDRGKDFRGEATGGVEQRGRQGHSRQRDSESTETFPGEIRPVEYIEAMPASELSALVIPLTARLTAAQVLLSSDEARALVDLVFGDPIARSLAEDGLTTQLDNADEGASTSDKYATQRTRKANAVKYGKRLLAARTSSGHSAQELADMSGVAKPQIIRYENGYAMPTLEVRQRLARVLGKDLEIGE